MQEIKFSRKDYMDRKCSHSEYYAQFITPAVRDAVLARIGSASIKASTDPHFNDIPLPRWDNLHSAMQSLAGRLIRQADPCGNSLSVSVCIAKEAARQIRDN